MCGANIINQTLLSLYSYNATSGIVVDIGERLEIVPVTDGRLLLYLSYIFAVPRHSYILILNELLTGYIVEGGVTRQPYGGHRITEYLNSSFTESKYRFFTDVEFQIVRLAMEKVNFSPCRLCTL